MVLMLWCNKAKRHGNCVTAHPRHTTMLKGVHLCHNDASMALEYNNSCAAPLLVNFAGAEILMNTLNMRKLQKAECNMDR